MSAEADLVMSRLLDAPLEGVWQAWTDCDRLSRWWGPSGYTTPFCRIDLRVGGRFLVCMRSPEGKDIWNTGVYREILPGRRIVSTDSFADERGNVVPPAHYGFGPDFPDELLLTITFDQRDGETELTVRHSGIPLGEDYGNTRIGWSQSLRKLAALLEPVPAGALR
jgi:uncharacterized protein YndB with AHSA1/START domain